MKINRKWVIGISVFTVFLILSGLMYYWMFHGVYNTPALGVQAYYDSEGHQLGVEQAVVGGVEGVSYITFQVNALNEDTVPLEFEIIDATPQALADALPLFTKKSAEQEDYARWVSDLVAVEPYIGSDQSFTVTVLATSSARKDTEKTSEVIITIEEDPEAGFTIDIDNGQAEDPGFEPEQPEEEDPVSAVKFRTTSLSYGSGAIAFNEACSGELIAYGYEGSSSSSGSCERSSRYAKPALFNVPHSSQTAYLYQDASDPDEVWICWDTSTGSQSKRFDKGDSSADDVITSGDSIEITKEVLC